eukprot:scaffold55517_cov63-Phaeocystis_antarctica.AAC.2
MAPATRLGCSHRAVHCPPRAPPRAPGGCTIRARPRPARQHSWSTVRCAAWPCAGTQNDEADDVPLRAALRGDRRQGRGPARRGGIRGGQARLVRGLQGLGPAQRGEGLVRVGV